MDNQIGHAPPPPPTGGNRAAREKFYGWVYEYNQWGRSPDGDRYYSDSPSELTYPYRDFVTSFIKARPEIRRVVDLACGDYNLASGIDLGEAHYIGVDIYAPLIDYNRQRYADERHKFLVLDIVEDELPLGDLCLISMALYLMSFDHVQAVLPKLHKYRYVLVTDGQADIPTALRQNIDKPTGKYTPRDLYGNGFYLEMEPFNVDLDVVHEYRIPSGEMIRTVLLEHPDAQPSGY